MIPGTTPTHTFKLPSQIDGSDISALRITYEQGGKIVLQKEKNECTVSEHSIVVKLSQDESLLFSSNVPIRIQVKVLTTGDNVLVSKVIEKSVYVVLDKEAI